MKQKSRTPQKSPESSEKPLEASEKIDVSETLAKIDKAIAKKKKKEPRYWTCNNRFIPGASGQCSCTQKFKATHYRNTSRAGLEKPIRCNSRGKPI